MEKLSMEELEELKEKEFAEKADRSKNTISLLRKHAFVLAVIVAALMLFTRRRITTIMLEASL